MDKEALGGVGWGGAGWVVYILPLRVTVPASLFPSQRSDMCSFLEQINVIYFVYFKEL